jgi:hypothetical protein
VPEYAVVSCRNDGSVVLLTRDRDLSWMRATWHATSGPVVLVEVRGTPTDSTADRVRVLESKAEPRERLQRRTMFRVAVLGLLGE